MCMCVPISMCLSIRVYACVYVCVTMQCHSFDQQIYRMFSSTNAMLRLFSFFSLSDNNNALKYRPLHHTSRYLTIQHP